jgi:hypothetical protein
LNKLLAVLGCRNCGHAQLALLIAWIEYLFKSLLLYWVYLPFGLGQESAKDQLHAVVRQQLVLHVAIRLFEARAPEFVLQ